MKIANAKLPIIFILFSLLISCKEKKTNDKTEDNPNKKIKKIEYVNKKDNVIEITEFYDTNENLIKKINHSKKYGDTKTIYKYNKTNNLIEESEFDKEDKKSKTKYYEYKSISDQDFLKTSYHQIKDEKRKLISKERTHFDDNGFLAKKTVKSVYANWEYTYTNHANGKLKKEVILGYDNTEKVIKTYNKKGKPIKEEIYRRKTIKDDFKLELTNNWYYDANGNETDKNGKLKPNNSPYKKIISNKN